MRRRVLIVVGIALLSFTATGQTAAWKWVQSLDCARIKVNGKGLKGAQVSAYARPAEEKNCCDPKTLVDRARTGNAGNFEFKNLKPGFYTLVFEKQAKRIQVALEVKLGSGGNCLETERSAIIQVNEKTGEIKVDSFIVIVD